MLLKFNFLTSVYKELNLEILKNLTLIFFQYHAPWPKAIEGQKWDELWLVFWDRCNRMASAQTVIISSIDLHSRHSGFFLPFAFSLLWFLCSFIVSGFFFYLFLSLTYLSLSSISSLLRSNLSRSYVASSAVTSPALQSFIHESFLMVSFIFHLPLSSSSVKPYSHFSLVPLTSSQLFSGFAHL